MRMLLTMALGLLPGIVAAQGLGGAARQAAERRAKAPPATAEVHRYSDADLRTESEGRGPEAPTPDANGGEPAVAAGPDAVDDPGGGITGRESADRLREELDRAAARRKESERTWRQRVAAARANLAAARNEHEVACNPASITLRGG